MTYVIEYRYDENSEWQRLRDEKADIIEFDNLFDAQKSFKSPDFRLLMHNPHAIRLVRYEVVKLEKI